MTFAIESAMAESTAIDVAVDAFRTMCATTSTRIVEVASMSPNAGAGIGIGLGDLARLVGEVGASHVFMTISRFDFEREIAAITARIADADPKGDAGVGPRSDVDAFAAMQGHVFVVHAVASFAGVQASATQKARWYAALEGAVTAANETSEGRTVPSPSPLDDVGQELLLRAKARGEEPAQWLVDLLKRASSEEAVREDERPKTRSGLFGLRR